MTKFSRDAIALALARLINASFIWTERDQSAVATINEKKPHKFFININGQEFEVTVSTAIQ